MSFQEKELRLARRRQDQQSERVAGLQEMLKVVKTPIMRAAVENKLKRAQGELASTVGVIAELEALTGELPLGSTKQVKK